MIFKKYQYVSDTFKSYNILASIFLHKNEIEKAKEYSEKCLKIAEKEKNGDMKAVAMGNFGLLLEDKDESLDYFLKSLKIFENENDIKNITESCSNIAEVYSKLGNYPKSYEFIKRALELQKEMNNFFEIAAIKENMAMIYYSDPKKPVRIDLIINFLKEASETYEKIGHVRGNANVHIKIGDIYFGEKDFKSSIEHYQIVAKIYYSLKQQSEVEKLHSTIGKSFVKKFCIF